MRRFLLLATCLFMWTASNAQLWDNCADAEANVDNLVGMAPWSVTAMSSAMDDGVYAPSTLTGTMAPLAPIYVTYYQFTIPLSAAAITHYQILVTPTSGSSFTGNDVSIGFVEGNCADFAPLGDDAQIGFGMASFPNALPGACQELLPNLTYTLAIATPELNVGEIEVSIVAAGVPTNDVCGVANEAISNGVALATNNNCATGDITCGFDASTSHVTYFTYTKSANVGMTLTISITAGFNPVDASGIGFEVFEDDCVTSYSGPASTGADPCSALNNGDIVFDCVQGASITLAIGSEAGDEGNYEITITESNIAPNRDNCMSPDLSGPIPGCVQTQIIANNENACPEAFAGGTGCSFDVDATTWYEVTFPIGTDGVEVSDISDGYVGLFTDACTGAQVGDCVGTGGGIIAGVTDGTYYIAYAGSTEQGILYNMLPIVPPTNDDCSAAIDISGAATNVLGSNACASADPNGFCAAGEDDHTVYYTYTVDAAITTNRDLTFTIAGGATDPATAISLGFFTDCSGTLFAADVSMGVACAALGTDVVLNCVPPGTTITIAIGSADGTEGSFDLTIVESNAAPANDECADADTGTGTLPDCEFVTINADNTDACVETFVGGTGCDFANDATVWYEIILPVGATGIEVQNFTGTNAYIGLFNDCTGTQEGDCLSADGDEITGLADGTYYIAATQTEVDPTNNGPFTFEIKAIVPPANDDCADAIDITGAATNVLGTNACATEDPFGFCTAADDDHTVYYTYTVDATITTNRDLTINVVGGATNPAAAISLGFFTDCAGAPFDADIIMGDACVLFSGDVVLNCVPPGTTITIAVGSIDGSEGAFDLTITESNASPANDECADADTGTGVLPDCEFVTINADNTDACVETFMGNAGCDFANDATVWYEIELPVGATGIEVQNFTGTNAYIGLFNDCTGTQEGDCLSADGDEITGLADGTYYIAATQTEADPTNNGLFTFDIKAIVPPANDDCADAEVIATGTATEGTTNCATDDILVAGCNIDATSHTVFYTYTNATGGNVDLDIVIAASTATTNFATTEISVVALADCAGAPFNMDNEFCPVTLGATDQLECIEDGETVIIMVASPAGSEGDFTITVTEVSTPPADDNDECISPLDVTPMDQCTWTTVNGTTVDACPEDFADLGACDFDGNPTVWYQIDAPAAGVNMKLEIRNLMGTGTAFLAVFDDISDCDAPTSISNNIGSNDCVSGTALEEYDIMPGSSYYIALGDDAEGTHSFEFRIVVPPVNDICDPDAIALTDEAVEMGTTLCASPEPLTFCGLDIMVDHVVYYTYEYQSMKNGDLTITIAADGATPATGIVLAVWTDCTRSEDYVVENPPVMGDECVMLGSTLEFECVEPGTMLTIGVGSVDGEEGQFTITVDEDDSMTPDNDLCADAEVIVIAADCAFQTVSGDNTGACPETFMGSSCDFDGDHVVWYSVEITAGGVGLEFAMFSAGTYVGVFDNDCDALALTGTISSGAPDCINTDTQLLDLTPGTYLIAVGQDAMAEGSFNFDIKTIVPPANDICDPDAEDISGSAAGGVEGTNRCATPEPTDVCGIDVTTGHAVYYTYTVMSAINTDLTISVTASTGTTGTAAGTASLGIWTDCDATIADNIYTDANPPVNGDECTTLGEDIDFACVEPGTVLTIAVVSPDGSDGDFTITITEDNSETPANDACADAIEIVLDEDCVFQTVDGDNTGACPEEFMGSSCDFDEDLIVWYSVTIPTGATGLEFENLTTDLYLGVFGNDCDALALQGTIDGGGPDCIEGDQQLLGLTPGTYLIGVGFDDVAEGTFSFDIKSIVPPANDLPCDAEVVDNSGGDAAVTLSGTTECATQEFEDPICADEDQSSVYYVYTVPLGVTGLTVTLANTGAADEFLVSLYDFNGDCSSTPALFDGDLPSLCDIDGDELSLSCLEEGTEIHIIVSTESDMTGPFDLTVDPVVPDPDCVDNDLCENVDAMSAIANPVTDDDFVCVTDCNLESCPEDFNAGACEYGELPTVFYSITTDADAIDATMSIIINGEDGMEPIFTVLTACFEDGGGSLPDAACIEADAMGTASQSGIEIMPNTTYILAVADQNIDDGSNGGGYEICVKITTSCNDDPCTPYPLDENGPNMYIANDCDTNIGSTQDQTYNIGPCGAAVTRRSVYFTYMGGDGIANVVITITNDASNGMGMPSEVNVNVFAYDAANCDGDLTNVLIDNKCDVLTGPLTVEIPCPVPGDLYLIQVATRPGEEGEFDIEVVETPQEIECTRNDLCDMPTELEITETCTPLEFSDCNIDACPEQFADPAGDCMFESSGVVWFTFTTPEGTTGGDFEVVGSGDVPLLNPSFAILQEDGCTVPPTAVSTEAQCATNPAELEGVALEELTTYLIIVGSNTADQGEFTINYQIDAAPFNDDPCIDSDNAPFDLTADGFADGSTCCARGFEDFNADGTQADWENIAPCSNATSEASVWYMFTPDADDGGYEVTVTGGTIMNNMGVQIYAGADENAGCNGFGPPDVVGSSCSDLNATIRFANCDPDAVYFIKVTTTDDDCGEFSISIAPASGCDSADDCVDALPLMTDTPESCEDGENFLTVEGCLDLACPEELTECGHNLGPTVWYQFDIDSPDANALLTQVIAPGFDVVWSIYQGTSCDDMVPVSEPVQPGEPALPCSDSDMDEENLYTIAIVDDPNTMQPYNYWIAITAIGEVDDPNFTLNYASSLGCVACSGTASTDCDNGLFTAIVDGEETDGPFCPGQEVTVCLDFTYDATATGNDWMHGIIPTFGDGWDIAASDLASANIGGNFDWFDSEGACAPYLNGYSLPNVCTYTGADGRLKICNVACDPSCPCELGAPLPDGSPIPSGWFTNTGGGSSTCGLNCSPASFYGISGGTFVMVEVCIPLVVKTFEPGECETVKDLSIDIQTTSDAISGCWEDNSPCIIDPSFQGPPWEIECDSPPLPVGSATICSGSPAGLEVTMEDGSIFQIDMTWEDNPNIDGEGTDPQWSGNTLTFPAGTGTINDVLVNNGTELDSVIYFALVVTDDFVCPGVPIRIPVYVYPEITVDFDPNPAFVCQGDCTDISPTVEGGTGVIVDYNWSTGEGGTDLINVCPVSETQYTVTVTDDFGCTGTGVVTVQVKDLLDFDLPEDIFVCKDGEFNAFFPDYTITPFATQGDAPFSWVFMPDPGLQGQEVNGSWVLNEEETEDPTGAGLQLCVIGETSFGCVAEKCMTIFVFDGPTITPEVDIPECGNTNLCLSASAFFPNGDPIPNLIIRSCDGEVLFDEIESTTGVFIPNECFDLNEYQCFEIVAYDNLSGCEVIEIVEVSPSFGVPIELEGDAVCAGQEVTLTVTNASDYNSFEWTVAGDPTMSIVSNNSTYTFTPDSTTTVFVETGDNNDCTANTTAVVTVNEAPVFTLAPQFTFCANSTATAEVSGGATYSWTDSGGTEVSDMATFTTGNAGIYDVLVTSADGCTSTASTEFIEAAEITINIIGDNLCDGADTELSFAGNFTDIVWTNSAGDTIAQDIDSVFVNAGGTYNVTATEGVCPASGTITIMEFASPILDLPSILDVCRDDSGVDSIFINFASLVTGIGGSWTQLQAMPATFVPPYTNVSFEGLPAGPYQFAFRTNTATMPCMNVTDTVTINVKSCPCPSVAVRDPQPICNDGGTVNLNSAAVKVTGEDGTWTVESGPSAFGNLITGATFTASDTVAAGFYGLLFTLADSGGPNCQVDSLIMIEVIDGPFAEKLNDGRLCNQGGGSDPITLDLNTLINATAGGTWTDADGNDVADPTTIDGTNSTLFPGPFPMTVSYTYTTMLPASSPCDDVSVTVDVRIRDCNCPDISVGDSTICNSAAAIDLADLLFNPEGLAGTWSTVPAGPLTGSMFDPAGLNSGSFDIIFTLDTDPQPGSNCALTYQGLLSVVNQPELTLTPQTQPCGEDTGNGPTDLNLYDWIDDGGTGGTWVQTSGTPMLTIDLQAGDIANVDFVGQAIGSTFEFTYTTNTVQDPPCVNPSIVVSITVRNCLCPPISMTEPPAVCNSGGELNLNTLTAGSDPGTFEVVRGGNAVALLGDTILDYTGATAGDYIITFTLDQMVSGSCIQDTSTTLVVSEFEEMMVTDAYSVCNNVDNGNNATVNFSSFLLTSTDQSWVDLDGAGVSFSLPTNVSFEDIEGGDYRFAISIINDAPCPISTDTVTITVDSCLCPLIQPLDPMTECLTAMNTMIDLTQYDDPGQAGTWSSDDFTITAGTMDVTGAVAGTYDLTYTLDVLPADPNCPTFVGRSITLVVPSTAGTGGSTEVCVGDDVTVDLVALLSGHDTGGSWTPATGLDPLAGTFNTIGISAGVYEFIYGFEQIGECPEDFATVTVTINGLPMADAGTTFELNCDNPTVGIGGPGTSTGSEFAYLWEELENNVQLSDPTTATQTVSAPGLYRLTVTNTATGCTIESEVRITQSDDKPSVNPVPTNVTCNGQGDGSVELTEQTGGDGDYTYSFNGGPFVTIDELTLTNLLPGDYTVVIQDGNGCPGESFFSITEPAPVAVTILEAPTIVGDFGSTFMLNLAPLDSTEITSIIWQDENRMTIATGVTSLSVTPEQTTLIYVTVANDNDCEAEASVQLILEENIDITFPNIINPQGSGNKIFYVNDDDVELVTKMYIFDRWGNKVFSRENVMPNTPSEGWDGTYQGTDVVPGVYVYFVEIRFNNQESTVQGFGGDVTVNK